MYDKQRSTPDVCRVGWTELVRASPCAPTRMEDLDALQVPVSAHAQRAVVLLDEHVRQLANVYEGQLEDVLGAAFEAAGVGAAIRARSQQGIIPYRYAFAPQSMSSVTLVHQQQRGNGSQVMSPVSYADIYSTCSMSRYYPLVGVGVELEGARGRLRCGVAGGSDGRRVPWAAGLTAARKVFRPHVAHAPPCRRAARC